MHFAKRIILLSVFSCGIFFSEPALGLELESRYATITYESRDTLRKFNDKLYLGNLKYLLQGKKMETVEDEIIHKIDMIIEKVQSVLDMLPAKIKFSIVIHASTAGVQQDFFHLYNKKVDYIAFYSPLTDTVFFSAKTVTLRVVAHEIGHVVAEKYFTVSPPPKIHEMLAQYAEMHITD